MNAPGTAIPQDLGCARDSLSGDVGVIVAMCTADIPLRQMSDEPANLAMTMRCFSSTDATV